MLKIKDNVDLKELEKYGFKPNATDDNYSGYYKDVNLHKVISIEDDLYKKRKITFGILYIPTYTFDEGTEDEYIGTLPIWLGSDLDTLYDLIKDGLVEKVEE